MQIKEVITRDDISATFAILNQIYSEITEKSYIEDILNMMQRGYKMAQVIDDDNNTIGVIGIRIVRKLHFGKALEIEDFMIDRKKRGIGVGKILMRWAEWQATIFGCNKIIGILESVREESQRIYSREGLDISGLFFVKDT